MCNKYFFPFAILSSCEHLSSFFSAHFSCFMVFYLAVISVLSRKNNWRLANSRSNKDFSGRNESLHKSREIFFVWSLSNFFCISTYIHLSVTEDFGMTSKEKLRKHVRIVLFPGRMEFFVERKCWQNINWFVFSFIEMKSVWRKFAPVLYWKIFQIERLWGPSFVLNSNAVYKHGESNLSLQF